MKSLLICGLAVLMHAAPLAQEQSLGLFEGHTDIGTVKIPGTVHFDSKTQIYTVGGSGKNMWFAHDDFHFVWKKIKGDFVLFARMQFKGKGTNPHRKMGWMVRQHLEPNSVYADAAVHGDGLTSLQYRSAADSNTLEKRAGITAPDFVQLARKGKVFILSGAKQGAPLQELARLELELGDEVYAGLFICSHDENTFEEAVFSNLRMTLASGQ